MLWLNLTNLTKNQRQDSGDWAVADINTQNWILTRYKQRRLEIGDMVGINIGDCGGTCYSDDQLLVHHTLALATSDMGGRRYHSRHEKVNTVDCHNFKQKNRYRY